jgi:hypothetical protein
MNSDILWHHDLTLESQIWFMAVNKIRERRTVVDEHGNNIFVGDKWRIVGVSGGAIVWHHDSTYETQIWFMNGYKISERRTVVDEHGNNIFVGDKWRIAGLGDFFTYTDPKPRPPGTPG